MTIARRFTSNDPKLSDRGVRRGTCMAGGKAAAEAGAVTHGAVRCSAWLAVAVIWAYVKKTTPRQSCRLIREVLIVFFSVEEASASAESMKTDIQRASLGDSVEAESQYA